MRFSAIYLAFFVLTGCSIKTTAQIVAECELKADQVYSARPDDTSAIDSYIETCMKAAGYTMNQSPVPSLPQACRESRHPYADAACYGRVQISN